MKRSNHKRNYRGTLLPGTVIMRVVEGEEKDRAVLSEYHGMRSKTAAYMIRKRSHKLVAYVDYPSQFFDLSEDPEELNDLADDAEAKAEQMKLMVRRGGRDAVIEWGDLGFSVAPGVKLQFD